MAYYDPNAPPPPPPPAPKWFQMGPGTGTPSGGGTPHPAQVEKENQAKQLSALFNMLYGQNAKNYAMARQSQRVGLKNLTAGFDNASKNAAFGAGQAKQSVLDNQQQALSSLGTSLQQSGLSNTTTNQNLQSGVYAQGSRSLGQIDQGLAAILADLQVKKGQGIAGLQQAISGLYQDQQGSLLDIAGLQTGNKGKKGSGGGGDSGIGQFLGTALGAIFASDRRLKCNIEHVGTERGFNVYEFEYTDGTPGRYRGVMADEVCHVAGAVLRGLDGYDRVDYGRLGIAMRRVR